MLALEYAQIVLFSLRRASFSLFAASSQAREMSVANVIGWKALKSVVVAPDLSLGAKSE